MTQHQIGHHYGGWIPQPKDHRDRYFHLEERILTGPQLPVTADLWPNVPAIWNQLQEGACTAHGSLRTLVTEMLRQGLTVPAPAPSGAPFSRQAQYWWTRSLEGSTGSDAGGTVRDAVKVLATVGAAPETLWPYSEPLTEEPPASVKAAAAPNVALKYQSVIVGGPGAPMRTALANGLAIVFGFNVPESFEDGSWDPATQPLPLPSQSEGFIGGHCVAVTGYDFSRTVHPEPYFICDNSWDTSWGGSWGGKGCTGGRFALDWDWFSPAYGLASDLWVLQAVK